MTYDLTKIYENLGETQEEDWDDIMDSLKGKNRTETLKNVRKATSRLQ